MPAWSITTNIRKSESMLVPPRNKSDKAEQMTALPRKTMAAKNTSTYHKESQPKAEKPTTSKKTCLCSPTTHPGSFRCRLHRAVPVWHHPSVTAEENSYHGTPSPNLKGAGNLSPAKVSRFCSSR